MRLLWITNQLFPIVAEQIGDKKSVIGGWTYSAAEEIIKVKDITFGVASLYMGSEFKELCINGVYYYLIPCYGNKMKYHKSFDDHCKKIRDSFHPDVVHIYGTEYPITLAYIKTCGNKNVVVSLQGVPTHYSRYFFSGIELMEILKRPVMLIEKYSFDRSNNNEEKVLRMINFFEGRSNWDRTVAWIYNPEMSYFHCNRTLRPSFYKNQWNIDKIERHSIFLSQAQYSIKGLHQVLNALPFILRKYPDAKIYIAGAAPFEAKGLKMQIKSMGYGKYIKTLINKYKLMNCIHFTGLMDADGMVNRYLSANVFVCPSSIENVPNSLAEAQILGVPCIASYVGGNSGLIEEGESGLLYRFEEYEMLAKYICDIFDNDSLALKLSLNGRDSALKRHNKEYNINTLLSMYKNIIIHSKTKI